MKDFYKKWYIWVILILIIIIMILVINKPKETEIRTEIKTESLLLQKYNKIYVGMNKEELISLLGNETERLDGDNTYLLHWGDLNMSKGYFISVTMDKETNSVLSKSEIGL